MADGGRRRVVSQPSDREMMKGVLAAGGPTPGLLEQARSLGRPGLVANGNDAIELCERMLAEGGPTPGLLDQVRSLGRPGLIANSNNSVECCEEKSVVMKMMFEIFCAEVAVSRVRAASTARLRCRQNVHQGLRCYTVQALERLIRGDSVCGVLFLDHLQR